MRLPRADVTTTGNSQLFAFYWYSVSIVESEIVTADAFLLNLDHHVPLIGRAQDPEILLAVDLAAITGLLAVNVNFSCLEAAIFGDVVAPLTAVTTQVSVVIGYNDECV